MSPRRVLLMLLSVQIINISGIEAEKPQTAAETGTDDQVSDPDVDEDESVSNLPVAYPKRINEHSIYLGIPVYTEWGYWSECSASCDGVSQRQRYDIAARDRIVQTKSCNPCADTTEWHWNSWTQWNICDAACGKGVQRRSRSCSGANCPQSSDKHTKSCRMKDCSEWGSWGSWGSCSRSCDEGNQSRRRECLGGDCEGPNLDQKSCVIGECPEWGRWGRWSTCSRSCDEGTKIRHRECLSGDCSGQASNSRTCSIRQCTPEWSEWEVWSSCSRSCDEGIKTRTRTCNKEICDGPSTEDVACIIQMCPPEWGRWGSWMSCSTTCGDGTKGRHRQCMRGKCPGLSSEESTCYIKECPPEWSSWNEWSPCSRTCNEGSKRRHRQCLHGICPGDASESGTCFIIECLPEWGSWDSWSSCSTTCDEGTARRDRQCLGDNCPGDSSDQRTCNQQDCTGTLFQCTFENGWYGIINEETDDFDWTRHSGKTQSSDTGPSIDHTWSNVQGYYIYTETSSPRNEGDVARIVLTTATRQNTGCLSFWYHMYGSSMGALTVYGRRQDAEDQEIWSHTGDLGDQWNTVRLDIRPDVTSIIFEGKRGSSYMSDMALDDIVISGTSCDGSVSPVWSQDVEQQLKQRFPAPVLESIRRYHDPPASGISFSPTPEQLYWWNNTVAERIAGGRVSGRVKRGLWFGPVQRKEYRQLTRYERMRFNRAVIKMMETMVGGISEYNLFVMFHLVTQAPASYGGAAFLPWHRECLFRFESVLQTHDHTVVLPYWDSTLDRLLPEPLDSIMWSDQFMGNPRGRVNLGPFEHWPVIPGCEAGSAWATLYRGDAAGDTRALYQDDDVEDVISMRTFSELASGRLEPTHVGPFVYIGGHVHVSACAPSDPIYWMHHAFVDCLWQEMRNQSQNTNVSTEYPNLPPGMPHAPDSPMKPFSKDLNSFLENKDGLQTFYTNSHYTYRQRPNSCTSNNDCGRYLFCHQDRCMSKVKVDGNCSGFEGSGDPCECGICQLGICQISTTDQWRKCY